MDRRSRSIILKNKDKLERSLSLEKIKPFLIKHNIFTKAMLEDIYDYEYNFFDELVTRGPNALVNFVRVLKEAGYYVEASLLDDNSKVSRGLCYKMYSKPVGYCLIINNVNFVKKKDERIGSDLDAKGLKNIFEKIGYEVKTERNLTQIGMTLALETFAAHERWDKVHSCVVIILSHGSNIDNKDVIYGTDDEYIFKSAIYDMFSNLSCRNLCGKPKIFIFQACRGPEEDYGAVRLSGSQESTDSCPITLSKSSTLSDILIVHSALPNHRSYRLHEEGSWLCQDLVDVLSEGYLKYDLETMLKSVTRKIQNRLSVHGGHKQGVHLEQINLMADIHFGRKNDLEYF